MIETGGWKWDSSAEWVKYFHEGLQLYHGYTDQGVVDPLSEILPYPKNGMLAKNYPGEPPERCGTKPVFTN